MITTLPAHLARHLAGGAVTVRHSPLQAPWLDGASPYQYVLAKVSLVGRRSAEPQAAQRFRAYKKRSMIGPSFLIVAAGHNFRSVTIALSRA